MKAYLWLLLRKHMKVVTRCFLSDLEKEIESWFLNFGPQCIITSNTLLAEVVREIFLCDNTLLVSHIEHVFIRFS
jgi:hypothetical protein